jgi:hypothetical protein
VEGQGMNPFMTKTGDARKLFVIGGTQMSDALQG